MKVLGLLAIVAVLVGLFWFSAIWSEKKGLLKDEDNDFIPDVIEDKVDEVKNEVKAKVARTKKKVKEIKDVINKK